MSHIFCLVWISLRAKMSYHCKAGENHCRPAYLSDTVVVDMQSGWDLNQLKLGNEETLKGTGITFVSALTEVWKPALVWFKDASVASSLIFAHCQNECLFDLLGLLVWVWDSTFSVTSETENITFMPSTVWTHLLLSSFFSLYMTLSLM